MTEFISAGVDLNVLVGLQVEVQPAMEGFPDDRL